MGVSKDPIERWITGAWRRGAGRVLGLALAAGAVHAGLVALGDLDRRIAVLLIAHAVLVLLMLLAWRGACASAAGYTVAVGAALVFRVVAALAEPSLSNDAYRYEWDGRVQLHGVHPYAHAPADPALADLRDETATRINHPELRTIYPPLAELAFAALAATGLGVRGFQLAFGLLDFGVVLALARLLAVRGLPRERVVLYAWNPLAILESAGSGHVEPLGVALLVLAAAWTSDERRGLGAAALGAAIQAKLLPLVLVPGYLRRFRARHAAVLALVVVGLLVPYATTGPALGAGLADYAERWEFNALGFAAVRGALVALDSGRALAPLVDAMRARLGDGLVPWERVARFVWPEPLARLVVGLALAVWIGAVLLRRVAEPSVESIHVIGAALLLAPTVHPWYVLWILPFAVAHLSLPWLAFAALAPLAYTAQGGDVAWPVRCLEYGPVLGLLLRDAWARRVVAREASRW